MSDNFCISLASENEIKSIKGISDDLIFFAVKITKGSNILLLGGVFWDHKCRCIAFIEQMTHVPARIVIRTCKKVLEALTEAGQDRIFALQDPATPTSARLLSLCGYKASRRYINNMQVWQWQK